MTRYTKKCKDMDDKWYSDFGQRCEVAPGYQHCVNIEMCAKDQSWKPTLRVNANISGDSQSLEFSNAICGHHFHCLLEWWKSLKVTHCRPTGISTSVQSIEDGNYENLLKEKSGIVGKLLVHLLLRPSSLSLRTRDYLTPINTNLKLTWVSMILY